jgi:hypothetical protein
MRRIEQLEIIEKRIRGIKKVEALLAAYNECAIDYRKRHFETLEHRQLTQWEILTEIELSEIQVHFQNLSVYVRAIEEEKKANQ